MEKNWYKKAVKEYLNIPEGEDYLVEGPERKSPEISDEDFNAITKDKWIPIHDSSFIGAIAYYEPLGILEVKIGGTVYIHEGVPKRVFDKLMKAESKGKFYNDIIKKRYGKAK